MSGMSSLNGTLLSGVDHLRQSIVDILTTPIGTRIMNREYGSRLYQLVDNPMNQQTTLQLYAAAVEALAIWESRLAIDRIQAEAVVPGKITISLIGKYLPSGEEITIEGVVIS